MKEKVVAKVEREPGEKNFSCYMRVGSVKAGVLGQGSSAKAAIADMLSGWAETVADLKEDGKPVPEIDIDYRFDVGSLFNYYDFINAAGVSREIGISPSLMRQYSTGKRKPGEDRKRQIISGIHSLAAKVQAAAIC